ncbi:MAG: hypothetical protein ACKPKO_18920, partial [Candidatus Fonsibacter sp.]
TTTTTTRPLRVERGVFVVVVISLAAVSSTCHQCKLAPSIRARLRRHGGGTGAGGGTAYPPFWVWLL